MTRKINIICTSKPGDGLLMYSYEHQRCLNLLGIATNLVIITHPNFTQQDYIESLIQKYHNDIKDYGNVWFDNYIPHSDDISLIMGRSMITLPYLDKNKYDKEQLLSLFLLFGGKLISVYSENHPEDYTKALEYFHTKETYDLCDYDVYPNGVGKQFEKMINFGIYKDVEQKPQFKYLFLGTNKVYYKQAEKKILDSRDADYKSSHGILSYRDESYLNEKLNHVYAPVKNLLGLFETYVYTKTYFDPAPRLIQECKWLGKDIIYLRDKSIKDGGPVYMNRPVPTPEMYSDNINILVELIKGIK